ncbi:KICSTOR complex protein ITFG2 isoform X6 [Balaenoptera musculus]|uniref:KICSTOR complex protein ITFG2 isoform X6 n=1 Tax=Balaenoptera musculus TaxID=9771 RepID=A0A8B8YMB6_BALMU|nr:KICSTOR complex protein ITFG2 isoform X6 [Balaenoptera musculus]
MRSVSYVQRVALEFSGSLFPHAICLGDVDNDTLNELVVGDTSGKLSVYKNDDSRPWLTCSCQGMLTCVGVGDVCNKGKNLVVAVSAEGWFHLCDLTPTKAPDASGHHETLGGEEQRPVFKQHIPANTKVMLISDIDGDGCCELVVGYTDRVVRAFRWEDLGDGTEHLTGQLVLLKKWMLEGQGDPRCPRRRAAPDVRPHPQQECLHSPHRQHQARDTEAHGGGGQAAVVGAGGPPALRPRETGRHGEWGPVGGHSPFSAASAVTSRLPRQAWPPELPPLHGLSAVLRAAGEAPISAEPMAPKRSNLFLGSRSELLAHLQTSAHECVFTRAVAPGSAGGAALTRPLCLLEGLGGEARGSEVRSGPALSPGPAPSRPGGPG